MGRRAQGEAGGNRGRDRGRAVVRAGKEDLTGGAGLSAETAVERVRATWAQVAASSGERRREAVLLAAERAQGAEGVAAEQRLGRGLTRAVTGRTGEGRSWAQKRGVSGGNGDGPDRWARAVRGAKATRGGLSGWLAGPAGSGCSERGADALGPCCVSGRRGHGRGPSAWALGARGGAGRARAGWAKLGWFNCWAAGRERKGAGLGWFWFWVWVRFF